MRKLIFMPFALLLLTAVNGFTQTPVPDSDTVGNPIQQGDPALETMPPGLDYVDDKKRITAEELPDAVRRTLENDTQYKNWKEAKVFHDRNTDEYVLEFTHSDTTTHYRFNKAGTPITEKE